ncbi:hypothetical protein F0L74_09820 [Chitinophaga agrisoli]|uniref:Virion morphogenesis family protein n=1 Tax=Chitinophaga agrisoli TaxID=2607653 RepID=A0A5B2VX90_9BACT|nr:phage virion morphogenesis protein [Chitinophaga agrisoli]KAA2242816.1 hypothetical protein F0L74_09820 [Chitinophaga agrisoli]
MKLSRFNFDIIRANVRVVKHYLPTLLANQAQNFFTDSWKRKGWLDAGLKPWAQPHRASHGSTKRERSRAILVKTGRLRRAVSSSLRQKSFEKIRFVVDVPYAAIHNEGGVVHIPAAEKILHFNRKGRFSKMAKAKSAQKVIIPAHNVRIPQRQFMGDSRTLRDKQIKTINKTVDAIWRG